MSKKPPKKYQGLIWDDQLKSYVTSSVNIEAKAIDKKPSPNIAPNKKILERKIQLRQQLNDLQSANEKAMTEGRFWDVNQNESGKILETMMKEFPNDKKLYQVEDKTREKLAVNLIQKLNPYRFIKNISEIFDISHGGYNNKEQIKGQKAYLDYLKNTLNNENKTQFKINPDNPNLSIKKFGGQLNNNNMESKYRKFQYGKDCKFGDFLQDAGKMMLNNVVTPVELFAGKDFYEPEYKGQAFEEIDKVQRKFDPILSAGMDIAGNAAFGPGYQAVKMGTQAVVDNTGKPEQPLLKYGGYTGNRLKYGGLTEINSGGTHEENPMGGVPVGNKASVEQGETIDTNNQYVFSDSITIDKDLEKEFGFKGAKGKTFAQFSKKIKAKGDPNNSLDQKAQEKMLTRLAQAQEAYKAQVFGSRLEEGMEMRMGGDLYDAYRSSNMGGPVKDFKKAKELLAKYRDVIVEMEKGKGDQGLDKAKLLDIIKAPDNLINWEDESELKKMALGGPIKSYSDWLVENPEGSTDDYELYKRGTINFNGTNYLSPLNKSTTLNYIDKGLMTNTTGLQNSSYKPGNANNYPDGFFTQTTEDDVIYPSVYVDPNTTNSTKSVLEPNIYSGKEVDLTQPSVQGELKTDQSSPTTVSSSDPVNTQGEIDYGYIAQEAARMAPAIANFISGTKYDKLNKKDYLLKNKINPYYMNIDPMLQDINEGYKGAIDATRNAVGGNAGTYLANLSSLQAGKSKSEYQARVGKYNADNEANMRAQLGNAELAKYNSGMSFQVDDWNMRSSEMAKNLMREGFANVGQYADAKANEAFMYEYIKATSPTYYDQVKKRGIRKPSPTQGS